MIENNSKKIIKINSNHKIKFTLFDLLCVLFLMHNFLPIVGLYMPSIVYGLIVVIIFIGCIRRISEVTGVKTIFLFLPMFIISILSLHEYIIPFDFAGLINYLYGFLQSYLYGLMAITYIVMKDNQRAKNIMLVMLACYVLTSITTIIGCNIFPSASRILATLSTTDADYKKYVSYNIGSFSFVYSSILLLPAIRVLIANKKINRIYGLAIIVLIGAMIISTEYTIALIAYLITIIILLIPKISSKKIFVALVIMIAVLIFAGSSISGLLNSLSKNDTSITRSARYQYIEDVIGGSESGGSSESGDRLLLYYKSLSTFVSSKGFGSWDYDDAGGHSYILDNLAVYGFLGAILIIIAYIYYYRKILRNVIEKPKSAYFLWGFILVIIFAIINPKDNLIYLTFVVPLISYVVYDVKIEGTKMIVNTEEEVESTLGCK